MTDKIIIDDLSKTIIRLQSECTQKGNELLILTEQYQRKIAECNELTEGLEQLNDQLQRKTQECEELKKREKYLYNFLTNRYNYGSFRPMWGAYLLKHFFNRDLGDFFDAKAYEMADTIKEKEKELNRYKQSLEKIEEIVKNKTSNDCSIESFILDDFCKELILIINEVKDER